MDEEKAKVFDRRDLPPTWTDRTVPWTPEHTRAWRLVGAWERTAAHYVPGYRLWEFVRPGHGRRDPRTVMVFKQVFMQLDTKAAALGTTAEDLIAAYWTALGPKPKFRDRLRPNWMLNDARSRMMLRTWRDYHAGRASTAAVGARRQAQEVQAMTADDRERARQSVEMGYARLEWLVRQGRIDEAWGEQWCQVEPWVEGETVLGPDDQYRDNLLSQLRKDVRLPDGRWVRWLVDEESVVRTHVVRWVRRRWYDSLVGLLMLDGPWMGREFLWGLGRVWAVPDAVAEAVKEAWPLARTVAGVDEDPARIWGASELRAWHEVAGAAVFSAGNEVVLSSRGGR